MLVTSIARMVGRVTVWILEDWSESEGDGTDTGRVE